MRLILIAILTVGVIAVLTGCDLDMDRINGLIDIFEASSPIIGID
jgi:hypothetical protein